MNIYRKTLLILVFFGVQNNFLYSISAPWTNANNTQLYDDPLNWLTISVPGITDLAVYNANAVAPLSNIVNIDNIRDIHSVLFDNLATTNLSFQININFPSTYTVYDDGIYRGVKNKSNLTQNININTGATLAFRNGACATGVSDLEAEEVNYNLSSGAIINFFDSSFAGGVANNKGIYSTNGGNINFYNTASVRKSDFTVNGGTIITFNDSSSAGTNGVVGGGDGNFVINSGQMIFNNNSTAGAVFGTCNITLHNMSNITFNNNSISGDPYIVADTGSTMIFKDSSSALGVGASLALFEFDASSIFFQNSATASNSRITLTNGGLTNFSASSTAATSIIQVLSGSQLLFTNGTRVLSQSPKVTLNDGTLDLGANTPVGSLASTDVTPNTSTVFLNTYSLTIGSTNDSTSLNAQIIGGAGSQVIKVGTGVLTLLGTNSQKSTTVAQGTLSISNSAQLGSMGTEPINFDNSGTVSTSGTLRSTASLSFLNPVAISNAFTGIFSVPNSLQNLNLQGQVTGAGILSLVGPGTFSLSANNTYSGGTTVNNTTLSVSGSNPMGTGTVQMLGTSSIIFTNNMTLANGFSLTSGSKISVPTGITATLNGNISGMGGVLRKIDVGDLIVSGSNTYDGGTFIEGGSIIIDAANNLGTNDVTIGSNCTLESAGTFLLPNTLILNVDSNISSASGQNFSVSDIVASPLSAALTKTGPGTLTLTQVSNYGGGTYLQEGKISITSNGFLGNTSGSVNLSTGTTLEIASPIVSNREFNFLNSGNVTIDILNGQSQLSGILSGLGGFIKEGIGKLYLSNVNNIYSGGTTINNGYLIIDNDSSLGDDSGGIVFNGGILQITGAFQSTRLINLSGSGTIQTDTGLSEFQGVISGTGSLTKTGSGSLFLSNSLNNFSGGTTINEGVLQLSNDSQLGVLPGSLTLNNNTVVQIPASSSLNIQRPVILNGNATITSTLGSGNSIISGIISGAGTLIKSGPDTLTLTGANTYGGGTFIQAGTIIINAANNLGTNDVTIGSNCTLESTGTFLLPNTLILDQDSIISVASGQNFSVSDILASPLSAALTKTGPGTLTLTQVSSYGGGTNLQQGKISISSDGFLGNTSGSVNLSAGTTLEITNPIISNREFNFVNSGNVTIDVLNGQSELNGTLNGLGRLIKEGVGKLYLSNVNNVYSGGTTINNGYLIIDNDSCLGDDSGGIVFNAGILEITGASQSSRLINFSGSGTIQTDAGLSQFQGVISGTGSLTKTGSGSLFLSNSLNNFSGGTIIDEGILQLSNDSQLGALAASLTLNNNTAVQIPISSSLNIQRPVILNGDVTITSTQGSGNSIISGIISGVGNLIKAGPDPLTLTGANTFTGSATISEGSLFVNGSLASSTTTTVSSNGLLGGNGVLGDVNAYGVISPGNSIDTLTVNNLVFFSGSKYFVEIDGNLSDKVIATGNIDIQSSATIQVDPRLGTIDSYTVLTASNVTGTFDFLDNPYPRFQVEVIYDPQNVILNLAKVIDFKDIITSGGLGQIANCFDGMIQYNYTSDLKNIVRILDTLTTSQLYDAFDQFDPGFFNAISFGEQSLSQRIREVYTDHAYGLKMPSNCEKCDPSKWGDPWLSILADHSSNDSKGSSRAYSGYNNKFAGITVGENFTVNPNLMLSWGFAYAKTFLKWKNVDAKADFDNYNFTAAAAFAPSTFIIDTSLGWTYSPVKASRRIQINPGPIGTTRSPPIDRTLSHKNSSNTVNGHIGIAQNFFYNISDFSRFFLRRFINLDYTYVQSDSYTEKGGGALDLKVRSKSSDLLRPELGLDFGFIFDSSLLYTLDFQVSYVRENRFSGQKTTASFAGLTSCSFDVRGLFPNRNLISTIGKFEIFTKNKFKLNLEYHGLFGSGYKENEIRLDFKLCDPFNMKSSKSSSSKVKK